MKDFSSMALKCEGGRLLALDQTRLPAEEHWVECSTPAHMIGLIQRLAVRGAPLIGVAAAFSLAQLARSGAGEKEFRMAAMALRESRPTAVNLMCAVDRMLLASEANQGHVESILSEAAAIFAEDVALCEALANRGAALVNDGDNLLTHCNAGGLATAGIGTALGVIIRAHQQGKKIHAFVDETRPLLQGARLSAWELKKHGVPHTLICDNMAGALMSRGKVSRVFVGADRIAVNGDAANKIGTYGLAVLAKFHAVPFYVVAPRTTFDPACPTGKEIPIEERNSLEVSRGSATENAWNPAFDVTPRALITNIIFDDKMI
jgi:methylthioribose-1-phosphate isomerase